MKKTILIWMALLMIGALLLTSCSQKTGTDQASTADSPTAASQSPADTQPAAETKGAAAPSATQAAEENQSAAQTGTEGFDPYAVANRYDVGAEMFQRQDGVDYGTLLKDVTYYSTVAGDNKQINILLPAGYDASQTYPVTYVFHGFGADHTAHIHEDSYLVLLYGNMLHQGLTVPQILVGMDMYTDKLSDKESKSDEELRYIYDKAIEETGVDLMPYIEANYPVKKGREYAAVGGVSEGGAKSLCTGFRWLDKFGYIGGFAPDTGVIPTEYFKGTFWNTPVFETFPQPTAENTPIYLYLTVGSKDPWNIDCTLYYRDVLNQMNIKNQTDYVEGYGHDADFWGQSYYNFLAKVFR